MSNILHKSISLKITGFIIPVLLLFGCHVRFNTIEGNGIMEVKEKSFNSFDKVEASGSFDVKIIPSSNHKVLVEADENLHEYIRVDQDGDRIKIRTKRDANIRSKKHIRVTVYMTTVSKIDLAGSCNLSSEGVLENQDKMELSIAGSGDANLQVKVPLMEVSIAGSGKIALNGKSRDMEINIGGSGDFRGEDFLCERVEVSIAGSGSARVFASVDLDVSIAGSGDVYYKGDPNVKKSIAGVGNVKPL